MTGKHRKLISLALIVCLCILTAASGCIDKTGGDSPSDTTWERVTIHQIHEHELDHADECCAPLVLPDINGPTPTGTGIPVEVGGTIVSQCPAGCWFIVDDGSGQLYVDLKPASMVIPPSVGKKVVVRGTVIESNGDTSLAGTQVIIDGRTYP
ncbi:hypothetical protein ASZ90_014690 [hydrocarbon metagenome]|uniref:Lipoprotein n=1 Tax=hydrocarbon metagenome TaxID=938273 RepID=A0A0W8F4B5_9ZZZZ